MKTNQSAQNSRKTNRAVFHMYVTSRTTETQTRVLTIINKTSRQSKTPEKGEIKG